MAVLNVIEMVNSIAMEAMIIQMLLLEKWIELKNSLKWSDSLK